MAGRHGRTDATELSTDDALHGMGHVRCGNYGCGLRAFCEPGAGVVPLLVYDVDPARYNQDMGYPTS